MERIVYAKHTYKLGLVSRRTNEVISWRSLKRPTDSTLKVVRLEMLFNTIESLESCKRGRKILKSIYSKKLKFTDLFKIRIVKHEENTRHANVHDLNDVIREFNIEFNQLLEGLENEINTTQS